MNAKSLTRLYLPESIKRMARMAAAQRGLSLSTYLSALVETDARRTGVANLVLPGGVTS